MTVRDTSEPVVVRALFLDPDVMLDPAKIAAAWAEPPSEKTDPAKAAFANAIDDAAVARLNSVLDKVPDMVVVFATHWRLLWSATDIAQILQTRGYRGTRFSSCHVDRKLGPTAFVPNWLRAQRDVGREVHHAVWAEECPAEELHRWATGAARTAQLLMGTVD